MTTYHDNDSVEIKCDKVPQFTCNGLRLIWNCSFKVMEDGNNLPKTDPEPIVIFAAS